MKTKKSLLNFLDFNIISSNFQVVETENEKVDLSKIPIEIDFEVFTNTEDESLFQIGLILHSNIEGKELSGYRFSIIANGLFQLKCSDNIKKSKFNQFIYFSALPMLISSVRSFLLNISSYAPFGKYLLPAIDLKDLVDKKIDSNDNKGE